MPKPATFHSLTPDEQFKMLLYFFAALDTLQEAHSYLEQTPLYRQGLKQKSKALMEEIDKVQAMICTHPTLSNIAYTEDWMQFKKMASVYANAIRKTPTEKIPELLALIVAYTEGGVRVEPDQVSA